MEEKVPLKSFSISGPNNSTSTASSNLAPSITLESPFDAPSRRFNFSITGELLPKEERIISEGDETENSNQTTPPEKYATNDISFKNLYTIPWNFVMKHVKNPKEAELLFDISVVGSKLDILMKHLGSELKKGETLERVWNWVWKSPDELLTTIIPIIGNSLSIYMKNIQIIFKKITTEMDKLWQYKLSLFQYAEGNRFLTNELKLEGCDKLAQEKLILSNAEALLASRLKAFFEKNPYAHSSVTWESIFEVPAPSSSLHSKRKSDQMEEDSLSQYPSKKSYSKKFEEDTTFVQRGQEMNPSFIEQEDSPSNSQTNLYDSLTQPPPHQKH